MAIPELLETLGVDARATIQKAGFEGQQFVDPDDEVAYVKASRLIALCTEVTGCEHFGLLLGLHASPSSLGLAGFLLQTAPDIGTSLHSLVEYLGLHDQGGHAFVEIHGDVASLGYVVDVPSAVAVDQIYDLSLTMIAKILASICGENWRPTLVNMTRSRPKDTTPYQRAFKAPIHYEANANEVLFPAYWVSNRPPKSDVDLFRFLSREAALLRALDELPFMEKVRQVMRNCLGKRDCSARSVAKRLGMHERTLHRRLQSERTTFRHELERLRFGKAKELLAKRHTPLIKVANALDYADTTAFIRAFKRWAGETPSRWRTRP